MKDTPHRRKIAKAAIITLQSTNANELVTDEASAQ